MRIAAAVSTLLVLAAACSPPDYEPLALVAVGEGQRVAQPIVTPGGRILSGTFAGSQAEIVEIVGQRAASRARIAAEGTVTNLQLARGPAAVPAMAAVTSCPGGFGDQPESEEFRTCVSPPAVVSVELDEGGRDRGGKAPLPSGIGEGTLFGSDRVFVWAGWNPLHPAVYVDGTWRSIATSPEASGEVAERCTTATHFWVLFGEPGSSHASGVQTTGETQSRRFELFRYALDGSAGNQWERVAVPGLESAETVEVACGDEEAFVRVGDALRSTETPDVALPGIEAGIDELRANAARRPVLFLEDMTCAVVTRGGRLAFGRERQGSATSPDVSICDFVPWPRGNGLVGLSSDLNGNVRVGTW